MEMPPEMSAEDVLNYTLDRTGEGLETGDFDLFAAQFFLPHKVSTFDGEQVLSTRDQMQLTFDRVRDHLAFLGATKIIRHVVTADYKTPTHVEGVHMSHVMNGDVRIKPPYPVFSIIKWVGGAWQIAASDYAIDPEDPQSAVVVQNTRSDHTPTHAASRMNQ